MKVRSIIEALRRLWGPKDTVPLEQDAPPFPATLLRGIRSSDWVKHAPLVAREAFMPSKKASEARAAAGYEPPGSDISINWEDDERALALLREDKANAKFGVARVQQLHLQHTQKVYRDLGVLRWERREIRGERPNPYHGNFVFPDGVPKHVHIAMVGLIAHHARVVAPDAPSDKTSQAPESGGVKD